MPVIYDDMIDNARNLAISCLTERDSIKEPNARIRKRLEYEAMKEILYVRYYAILIYARMNTPLSAFSDMLKKWRAHLSGSILPCERDAMLEAIWDMPALLEERGKRGEEITDMVRLDIQTYAAVIETEIMDIKNRQY